MTGLADAEIFPAERDLVLPEVEVEASVGAEIEAQGVVTDQCTKPLAATAEKSARCPLSLQTESLFIAVTVLRKWAEEDLILRDRKDPIIER